MIKRREFLLSASAMGAMALPGVSFANSDLWSIGSAEIAERDKDMPLIGLEEHFATPEMMQLNNIKFPPGVPSFDIMDVGVGRVAHMDEAGLNIMVLSALTPGAQLLPGQQGIDYATRLNDQIKTDYIDAHPDRFRGFAALPLTSPEAAALELERCVNELGFVGTMTYGAVNGMFLDHPEFEPVLTMAETLGVPIYIHPGWASKEAMDLYYDDLGDPIVSRVLSGAGYGWHQEVALQCLRMIVSGVFDRHPNLQIIIGHMGEALPFYYWRIGDDLAKVTTGKLQKPVQSYVTDNFHITTSAFFRTELLELALTVMGEDRVLFSTDYPFVSGIEGAEWFRGVDLPRPVKEKIGYKNAEKLLNISL
ncbi:amidohydrolase family protein [Ruegeria arenilitoris]|uniref:amidohydrolase family protein n=1 Tax=Ruegeria arenilitoris TaxID=1173585 RepID=UPI001C2B7965|nr:amidohydrolase family protein [Ruegeria arenilitoris]